MSPERLTKAYAAAMLRLDDTERALARAFKRWDKLRRAIRRYEKRLDTLAMQGTRNATIEDRRIMDREITP